MDDGDRGGSARLAHRVLGDEHGPPRPVVRHPHRRRRPHLPAPRGRDRPERGGHRTAVRRDVAALRPPPDGRHEDGQVDRQHRPRRPTSSRPGSRRAPCATRSSPSTTGWASTIPTSRWRPRRRPSPGSMPLVAALDAYRQDGPDDPTLADALAAGRSAFGAALDDDLNVSEGLAAVFELVRDLNRRIEARTLSSADAERALAALRDIDQVLGVLPDVGDALAPELQALLDERVAARAARDWAASDRLRDELAERGDRRGGHARRPTLAPPRGGRSWLIARPTATDPASHVDRVPTAPGAGHVAVVLPVAGRVTAGIATQARATSGVHGTSARPTGDNATSGTPDTAGPTAHVPGDPPARTGDDPTADDPTADDPTAIGRGAPGPAVSDPRGPATARRPAAHEWSAASGSMARRPRTVRPPVVRLTATRRRRPAAVRTSARLPSATG